MKKKIIHIIGGLEFGGAENMLQTLALNSTVHEHLIFSLSIEDRHSERFRERGCDVETFGIRIPSATALWKKSARVILGMIHLYRQIKRESPDIVQTWMYQSDIIGGVIGRALGIKVCWGIFNSNLDRKNYRLRTNMIILLCARLSRVIPHEIWSCSRLGVKTHAGVGYPRRGIRTIPAGVNTDRFKPVSENQVTTGNLPSKDNDALVVGTIARWDPQKDYRTLLHAFKNIREEFPRAELWLAGGYGIDDENEVLISMIEGHKLTDAVRLFGALSDRLIWFYRSLDVFVLSSLGEGVPNVILEAMSMEVPCLGSDVGDIADVLDDIELIVERQSIEELSKKLSALLSKSRDERREIGRGLRQRVQECYSSQQMVQALERMYSDLAKD